MKVLGDHLASMQAPTSGLQAHSDEKERKKEKKKERKKEWKKRKKGKSIYKYIIKQIIRKRKKITPFYIIQKILNGTGKHNPK